ncbi:SusC/RagA family TonB-linked outer membrane protein [Mangrovibacterium sp.]|uniref:SusC/RagA family TonB-linked outer membrane protein n=1 Tax=Mangrovibacterium sp. TaxID=1961364 RepID=UPI0035694B17
MKKSLTSKIFGWTILIVLLLVGSGVKAQQKVLISGKVVSSTDGEPLIGVTVAEKDKNNRIISGVTTDLDGNYALKVSNTANTLTFSFIGFKSHSVTPKDKTKLNIKLEEDVSELGQVEVRATKIVNTGDFNLDKSRIATAMQTLETKDISDVQASSVVDQLQGRMSGVDITAESGEPGAGMSIRIRGTSSLNASSEPLVVINGVPFETTIDESFDFGSADEQGYASLIGVSPEDIQEISVLKDAAATAQYGSRAANGVLLITTKRGKSGKAVFDYTYKGTIGFQPDGFPMLNGDQYTTLIREELMASSNGNPGSIPQIEYDPTYELYNLYNKNTDWIGEITQTEYIHEHNLSVSGGGDKATYRISATMKDQQGTTVGTGSNLVTTRAILDYYVSDKIRVSSELSFSHSSVDKSYSGLRDLALRKMPNMSIYEVDSEGNPTDVYYTPVDAFQGTGSSYYNPVAMANLSKYKVTNNRITPIFRVNYRPIKNLTYDMLVSFDVSNDRTLQFIPEEAVGVSWTDGLANNAIYKDAEFYVIRTENKLAWNPKMGEKHSLFVGGKFETYEKNSIGYYVETSNSPSSLLQTPISEARLEGSGNSLSSSYSSNRTLAANFMFNYQFDEKYTISGGVRSEGNSKFGSDYRNGVFPSIALKWDMSKERFMDGLKFVDELSFRGSYGVNGNAPSFNYGSYSTYGSYSYNYIDVRPAYPTNIELSGLKWETVIQENLGFNLTMFNYRVNADVEIYRKKTKDILSKNTSIPSTSGFSTLAYLNLGDINNEGFEVSVMTKVIEKKNFALDFNFNFSRNVNLIKRITDAMDVEDGDPLATGSDGYLKRIQEDNPIGSFYGYRYKGVYASADELAATDEDGNIIYDINGTAKGMKFNNSKAFASGDAKYEDVNHDGNINRLDVVYLGNANPLLVGGFGPVVKYKNFRLTAFFNFRYNQKVINLARMTTEAMTNYDNQNTSVLRRWRYEGQVTDVPRAHYNSTVNTLGSDRFLEDASFMRLKYLTVRYDVPKTFAQKLGMKKLAGYVTGNNLFTLTNYMGTDPETGQSSNWKTLGYDTNKTPRSIQFTLGINATF